MCFDIGANVGYKSKLFLSLGAKVIAFEPQSQCHKTLLKIKNLRFKLIKKAIGSVNENNKLYVGNHIEIATLSNKFKEHFTRNNVFWSSQESIETVTLDSQIDLFGVPDFCKIDTEGYEYEILSSLSYTIPILEFEFTDGFIDETTKCIQKLSSQDNYEYNYILNEKNSFEIIKWVDKETIITIINTLPSENLHGNIFARVIK